MKKKMLLLTLLVSATVVAKPVNSGKIAHHQTVSCGNQVYVQSSGGAVLKEKARCPFENGNAVKKHPISLCGWQCG